MLCRGITLYPFQMRVVHAEQYLRRESVSDENSPADGNHDEDNLEIIPSKESWWESDQNKDGTNQLNVCSIIKLRDVIVQQFLLSHTQRLSLLSVCVELIHLKRRPFNILCTAVHSVHFSLTRPVYLLNFVGPLVTSTIKLLIAGNHLILLWCFLQKSCLTTT